MTFRTLAIVLLLLPVAKPVHAAIASSFDDPDTAIASNTVIDMVEHDGLLWFGTGAGVNFTPDTGGTWLVYNSSNGLVSSDISALFSIGDRLWVASNHNEEIDDQLFSISDGISFTDDNGQNWTQIDFGPDGLNIPRIFGGDQTVFDITGHIDDDRNTDWLFFTAFAGGFLASQDGGTSWRRIFPSVNDSLQWTGGGLPSLRNRYFSCRADTSHGDSLIVWTGTAGGVIQYIFAKEGQRLESAYISDVTFSDPFVGDLESYIYLAGDAGVTRVGNRGQPSITAGVDAGLPGPFATTITDIGGRILVGTRGSQDGPSTGLAYSEDLAESFIPIELPEVTGMNRTISAFDQFNGRLYMAAEEAGLWVSDDTGLTWQHLFVDQSDTTAANRRNVVHAVHAYENILMLGTDSGTVFQFYDTVAGTIDSTVSTVFLENFESSRRIERIRALEFIDDEENLDSVIVWTINTPTTSEGTRVIARSNDLGQTWMTNRLQDTTLDIGLIHDTTYRVGRDGVEFDEDGVNPNRQYGSQINDPTAPDDLGDDVVTRLAVRGSFIVWGTGNGFAVSFDGGQDYRIYRPITDSLRADRALTINANTPGIVGEFVPALGVQYFDDQPARVWVSSRPSQSSQTTGISVGLVVPLDVFGQVVHPDSLEQAVRYDYRWGEVVPGQFAWNFAFNGDSVFACTDDGLMLNHRDTGRTWKTIDIVDDMGNPVVSKEASIFSAKVYAGKLWVGNSDSTVTLDLNTLLYDTSFGYVDTVTPAVEVYAYPTPFRYSETRHKDLKFRVALKEATTVTIEVYDFAMNLVARPLNNAFREPQFYQSVIFNRDEQGEVFSWIPRTADGDRLAVGMYYFKVELGTGEVRWGKLAIMP